MESHVIQEDHFPSLICHGKQQRFWKSRKISILCYYVMDFMAVSLKMWDRKCAFLLLEPFCHSKIG